MHGIINYHLYTLYIILDHLYITNFIFILSSPLRTRHSPVKDQYSIRKSLTFYQISVHSFLFRIGWYWEGTPLMDTAVMLMYLGHFLISIFSKWATTFLVCHNIPNYCSETTSTITSTQHTQPSSFLDKSCQHLWLYHLKYPFHCPNPSQLRSMEFHPWCKQLG